MMNQPEPELVEYAQLKEEVGSLFFLWAQVERTLADARRVQDGKIKSNLRATVEAWAKHEERATDRQSHHATVRHVRNEMLAAIEVRNRFAHGFVGGTARLHPDHPEAFYITRLNDEVLKLTFRELKAWNTYVARLDASVWRLTGAAKRREIEVADMYHDIHNLLTEAAPPGRPPAP
jgi:hypothetical protein